MFCLFHFLICSVEMHSFHRSRKKSRRSGAMLMLVFVQVFSSTI
uniref:Uncharacterized protein n=1 Tax=Musa acuminata subsp. malaccensis TaxID=214687 RepID=A0A804KKY9_MUSAM